MLTRRVMKKVWVPDSYFVNAKTGSMHRVTTPNMMLLLGPSGVVKYNIRYAGRKKQTNKQTNKTKKQKNKKTKNTRQLVKRIIVEPGIKINARILLVIKPVKTACLSSTGASVL